MLPSLNNTVGSKEYKYQCNEARVRVPREKREDMPTSMTRPEIENPLDKGRWQIWCKYDYEEELNSQGSTGFLW